LQETVKLKQKSNLKSSNPTYPAVSIKKSQRQIHTNRRINNSTLKPAAISLSQSYIPIKSHLKFQKANNRTPDAMIARL